MRIAFLTTEFGDLGSARGGLGTYLARVTPLLAARGHECEVFLCSGEAQIRPGVLDHAGVRVRRLAAESTPFDSLAHPVQVRNHLRSAWALAESLAEAQTRSPFDVVQVPNYGASGLFVDVPVPVVMRFSSHARTWHEAAGGPRNLRVIYSEMLQRQAIRRADRHYAPSRFVAGLVHQATGRPVDLVRPPAAVGFDRNGWDESWVREVTGGAAYLLHAGQLGRAKGTDLVLEAAGSCLARRPDLHLHLCGRDAGAGPAIESLRGRLGDRIHDHGRVPLRRLHPLMAGARAVIAPSRADNLPNVVIEAMSIGTPVVGVESASIDELVVDRETGFLARPEDPESLAAGIEWILELPPAAYDAMRSRARRHIRSLLDEDDAVEALAEYLADAALSTVTRRGPREWTAIATRVRLSAVGYPIMARNALVAMGRRIDRRVGAMLSVGDDGEDR